MRGLAEPILIDEWQLVPEVLGAVKRTVDADPRPGRFIITGSVRGEVDEASWPGTGRLLRIAQTSLTGSEIFGRIPAVPLIDRLASAGASALQTGLTDPPDLRGYAELTLTGGFPEPALRLPAAEQRAWYTSYLDQLLTRDVAELSAGRDPERMRRYLEAYALNTAGVVDARTLMQAAGVAKATGEAYERLLRDLLVVDALPAWWTNRLKRLVRAPKRHLVDPALALAAIRIDLAGLMADGDLLGRVLDTFVVAQLRAELPRAESEARLFHLRQEDGRHEVDIVVEYGGGRIFALEVKAGAAPRREDARHLRWLKEQLADRFIGGAVLHTGPSAFELDQGIVAAPIAALWG